MLRCSRLYLYLVRYEKELKHKYGTGKLTLDLVPLTPFRFSLSITLTPLVDRPESVSYYNIGASGSVFVSNYQTIIRSRPNLVMYDNLMDSLKDYFGYSRYGDNFREIFYDYEKPDQIWVTVNSQVVRLPRIFR
ncbi:hypothetical protein FOL47_010846 [Perkinsus chesapeaki]|uniref:Uncharacterized protein n=1 Tax=Perkinsus chesapeaki TaxID=330153 RepID=A0A7J6L1T1_PERCH|nr:hypothetical protein FOL47_010846 [Perkinsus chesapeaki]